MKKKILIGSIFAVLLMLSMPVISNIQAEEIKTNEAKAISTLFKEYTLALPDTPGLCAFYGVMVVYFGFCLVLQGAIGITQLLTLNLASLAANILTAGGTTTFMGIFATLYLENCVGNNFCSLCAQ